VKLEGGTIAAQALIHYSLRMRITSLSPILLLCALATCAPPGRNTFAPAPVGADTASVSATKAFSDRIALITILPGTTDFSAPVASAVRQALAIKPDAKFEVSAVSPASATPDASATELTALSGTAAAVAKAIVADGVPASNVTLTAKSAGLDSNVLVYVK
jgi:hypothetical protein